MEIENLQAVQKLASEREQLLGLIQETNDLDGWSLIYREGNGSYSEPSRRYFLSRSFMADIKKLAEDRIKTIVDEIRKL